MILYNFATRMRPEKFFACLNNIKHFSNRPYKIIAKIDDNDPSDYSNLENHPEVRVMKGKSKNKIHAINRDLDITGATVIVNMSDDMWFKVLGFDEIILKHTGPDDFVHFPDGFVNERLSTMSIMGVDYYKRFNYIYHPHYTSLWCDNEAQAVAVSLGRYKYVDIHIFEHRHPQYGKAAFDAQYKKTESFYHLDKAVFEHRKKLGFPL